MDECGVCSVTGLIIKRHQCEKCAEPIRFCVFNPIETIIIDENLCIEYKGKTFEAVEINRKRMKIKRW